MAEAFGEHMKLLPVGIQRILLDDLVTVLEGRLEVLKKAEQRILGITCCELKIIDELRSLSSEHL